MARTVIPGIYMIRNRQNGKVYIGQSKDILRRFRQYYWGATTVSDYDETEHPITRAIRTEGIDNFDFLIVKSGPQFLSAKTRIIEEAIYIRQYKADDPDYGYNERKGGQVGSLTGRQQDFRERLRRAKPAFLYNIENESVQLYMFGAKAIADDFGTDKAITSHAMNRCDVFAGKYYIIPANATQRAVLLSKKLEVLANVKNNPRYPNRTTTRADNRASQLIKAYDYIEHVAPEFGFSV